MATIKLTESEISLLSSLLVELRTDRSFDIKNLRLNDRSIAIYNRDIDFIISILDKLYKHYKSKYYEKENRNTVGV